MIAKVGTQLNLLTVTNFPSLGWWLQVLYYHKLRKVFVRIRSRYTTLSSKKHLNLIIIS